MDDEDKWHKLFGTRFSDIPSNATSEAFLRKEGNRESQREEYNDDRVVEEVLKRILE